MKSLRTLGVFVGLLAVSLLAVVAVMKNGFSQLGVGEISEITPEEGSTKKLPPAQFGPDDWPWWRGGRHDGCSPGKAPLEWSESRNIVWKSAVPGSGHASPVVFGERIFIATADEQQKTQSLVCFDRKSGKQLWAKVIHTGGFMKKHPKNSQASATPACDGQRVFVAFVHADELWVSAVDFDGNIVWQEPAGPFASEHGYGSSPAIYESLVIVNGDSLGGGFVAALHRESGKIAWRKQRPNGGKHGSYASPILAKTAGKPQLILHGANKVCSYDPANGELVWHCAGPSQVAGNTVAFDDNHVVATGGFPEEFILRIRADGTGDVTDTHVVWRSHKGVPYVPSPLIADGLVYFVADKEMMTCCESASGKQVWKERLHGAFTASPVLAGGLLYVANEAGETFVVKAGRQYERMAVNQLDEGTLATPAIAGGRIYLRTTHHLYCIGHNGPF
jgi:outer membrane protein assembly factor BamB